MSFNLFNLFFLLCYVSFLSLLHKIYFVIVLFFLTGKKNHTDDVKVSKGHASAWIHEPLRSKIKVKPFSCT